MSVLCLDEVQPSPIDDAHILGGLRPSTVPYKAVWMSQLSGIWHITCSTVVLQCYRRQAIPMEQGKIRPLVTLYS